MVSDFIHARHAAQLGNLKDYFEARGWSSRLVEPGKEMPVHVLLTGMPADSQGRERVINFAFIPTGEDDLDNIVLLQLYSPLPFKPVDEHKGDVESLLMVLNATMPIGFFSITGDEIFLRYVYTASRSTTIDEDEMVEMTALFLSMQEAFGGVIEAVATGEKALDEVLPGIASSPAKVVQSSQAAGATILDQIKAFFEARDWEYTPMESPAVIVEYEGESGLFNCFAQAREEEKQVIFYSVSPVETPPDRLGAMAEFIARANYGMYLGNFELDMSDGEVRFKTSVAFKGDGLTPALMMQVVYPNVAMMDNYLPGIKAVIDGTSAADAIEQVEG